MFFFLLGMSNSLLHPDEGIQRQFESQVGHTTMMNSDLTQLSSFDDSYYVAICSVHNMQLSLSPVS